MNGFSPTETATEGIRLTRLRSRAVGIWVLSYLGFIILVGRIAELTLGPHAWEILAEFRQIGQDGDALWSLAGRTWPFFAASLPIHLAFQSILTCAIYRAVLHSEEEGGGYLRIGADEVRMAVLIVIVCAIWTLAIFLLSFVSILAASTLGLVGSPIVAVLGFAITMAALGVVIWVLVRLSLAGAITFSDRRIQVMASWRLTQGRFWSLLWSYFLAFLLWLLLVGLIELGSGLLFALVGRFLGVDLRHLDPASADPLIFAAILLTSAGTALLWTCTTLFMNAPPAEAYRELTQG